jgi:hypothetical protein
MEEEFQYIHVGNKIKEVLSMRGWSKTDLGNWVGMTVSNAVYLTKRPSIDVVMLHKIGIATQYDFWQHFPIEPAIQDKKKITDEKDKVIEELKAKMAKMETDAKELKREMDYVKRENETLRDVITLMKKK